MNRIQKIVVGATMTGSALAGGAIGAALLNGSANAQTFTSTTAPAAGAAPAAPADTRNNDPAHEATESAQREADEAAGRVGSGRDDGDHLSNKDPAHEAAESPARAAEEAARDAAIANGSGGSPSTTTTTP